MIEKAKKFIITNRLVLIVFLIYLIFISTPIVDLIGFIPDYFHLSKLNSQDYFSLMIGAIASIFGIIMAVVIIAIEFSKERINYNSLNDELVKNAINYSVSLIAILFVSYIQIDFFETSKQITVGYYLGLLFLLYLYSVYPVIKRLVGKSSRIKENIDLAKNLNQNSFKAASRYRLYEPEETNEVLKTLKKELDLYILSNNISAYEKINKDILSKALNLISKGQNRQDCNIIISGLVWLWRENCKTAIRVNDTHYFELIWNYIQDIYVYFANNKAPLLHLQDLHFFIIFDFLKSQIQLNNLIPFSTALDCIELSFKANLLNNCPKQEDLRELVRLYEGGEFEDTDSHNSIQWNEINSIFGLINRIQEIAITLSDKDLFEESTRRIKSICSNLFWEDWKIGKYQKRFLTLKALKTSSYNSHKALNSGLYSNTLNCFDIPTHLLESLIKNNDIDIKDIRAILRNLSDYLILAFKERKLYTSGDIGTLHDYCMIGIYTLEDYKTNDLAKQTVDYIVKVLKHLKKIAETDLSLENSNDYLAIKSKIKHFVNVAMQYDSFEESKKPIKKWQKVCNDFKDVSKIKDFGIVKW